MRAWSSASAEISAPDGADELLGRCALAQVARGARGETADGVLIGRVHAEDEDPELRSELMEPAEGIEAAAGHRQVEQDQVRLQSVSEFHGLLAVARLTDDPIPGLLEHLDEIHPN